MTKTRRYCFLCGLFIVLWGMNSVAADLCTRVDMKPVLSLDQVRMNELADFLCEIAGLKALPSWPAPQEIRKMTAEEYYQMEIKILVENGFPSILMDIEPTRIVNRRFFVELMFPIAMEVDPKVQQDCKAATTETERLECLVSHDWVYARAGKIYREEILSVLCEKKKEIEKIVPPSAIIEIYPEEFKEGILEAPATAF